MVDPQNPPISSAGQFHVHPQQPAPRAPHLRSCRITRPSWEARPTALSWCHAPGSRRPTQGIRHLLDCWEAGDAGKSALRDCLGNRGAKLLSWESSLPARAESGGHAGHPAGSVATYVILPCPPALGTDPFLGAGSNSVPWRSKPGCQESGHESVGKAWSQSTFFQRTERPDSRRILEGTGTQSHLDLQFEWTQARGGCGFIASAW